MINNCIQLPLYKWWKTPYVPKRKRDGVEIDNLLSKPTLPEILKKRLVFGNKKQIAALNGYQKELEDFEDQNKMKKFECSINISSHKTIYVRAHSEEDAREIAQETSYDCCDDDIDIDVEEIK